jgi:exodeoxyribonuclease V beta subunit
LTQEILLRTGMAVGEDDGSIAAVAGMAERVLASRLPGAHFALRDVPHSSTLREWEFHLPLGTVERDTLARIFAEDGGELARRYAPALRRIGADRTHGFLTGVIDLALVHEGRWYVVDWKSNHLGNDPAQYEPAALEREMFASHYVLQYHLYVTALHRYLRLRQPGYDYDVHMGGVWYSFLRGVDGSERGWFADRPPRALIEALDALMGEPRKDAQERVA